MKRIHKLLSLILTICIAMSMLTGFAPANAVADTTEVNNIIFTEKDIPEYIDYDTAVANGHIQRLKAEEVDLNTAIFQNADGSKSMYIFEDNVKYIDRDGNVRDKSNQLIRTSDGFVNEANDVQVFYPDNIDLGIEIAFGDYQIKMMPLGTDNSAGVAVLQNKDKSSASNKVEYDNIFGNSTQLVYTQTLNGTKEEIVLEENVGKTSFSFQIFTNGLYLVKDNNIIEFIDRKTNKPVASLGAILMWDGNGVCSEGSYTLRASTSKNTYIVTIDASSLLDNDNISYPITIDPSITVGSGSTTAIEDASIFTNYNENFGTWMSLFVGDFNEWYSNTTNQRGTARSLVKFPGLMNNSTFLSLYNNGYITSVKYNFSDIDCDSGPNTINAYLLTSNWNESTVVYSNSLWNAYGTYIGSTTIAPVSPRPYPYPRYEIDITTAVEMWLTGSATNYGIMLKANDESKEAVVLGTSESGSESVAGRTDSRPYVVVNYSTLRDNQIYRFKNVASGLYMNVSYGYDTNELNVFQTTKEDQYFAQEFRLSYDTNESSYRIHPICSMNGRRRVLDVVKSSSGVGGLTSGCNLQIYSPTDDIAELFNIVSVGTGQYKIVLKYATNIAISANGNSNGSASGTSSSSTGNVIMTEYTGSASQKWVLERSERNEEELYYSVMNVSYPFRGTNVPIRLSSGFGYRKHPVTGANYSSHGGIDIPASSGTQLYSVFDGQVKVIDYESNSNSGRGHFIIVEATNDYNNVYLSSQKLRYVYMHMKESPTVTNPQVVKNAYVDINTLIGKVGTTGASTGNHLHLSFIVNGGTSSAIENVVNPMVFYPDIDFTY
ncbi:MAG: DNRLRE domain-containing protein [Alphaproteobacteria bacterium]|nr:DNRLRE domain-containing protein [Alphaproteobacteria bacterium]